MKNGWTEEIERLREENGYLTRLVRCLRRDWRRRRREAFTR